MSEISMFMPFSIVKGEITDNKGKKRTMLFKGIASNMDTGPDMDGEILDPNGFDYTQFLKSGHINWNHQSARDPLAIIGEPTSASVVDNKFIIEGFLYEESELAQKVYKAATILEKSGSKRRLGFSIEGNAVERDAANKKLVKKAAIHNVAIAPTPKNAGTALEIVKGLSYDTMNESLGLIVDVISDGQRIIISKGMSVDILSADSVLLSNDEFESAVVSLNEYLTKGEILCDRQIIKSHLQRFNRIMDGTMWLLSAAH